MTRRAIHAWLMDMDGVLVRRDLAARLRASGLEREPDDVDSIADLVDELEG